MSPKAKTAAPPPAGERLFLAILKTADILGQEAERLTKSIGLTATQYNVLRILRGAGPDGLPCRGEPRREWNSRLPGPNDDRIRPHRFPPWP